MVWLMAQLAFGACGEGPSDDADFTAQAPVGASEVRLLLEVWSDADSVDKAVQLLDVLAARDVPATLALPLKGLPAGLASRTQENELLDLALLISQPPRDPVDGPKALRRAVKAVTPKGNERARVAVSKLPTRTTEAILGKSGFKTLLVVDGPSTGTPRRAVVFEGQPVLGVVVPPGPYTGPCGTSARQQDWTIAAADRATQALHGAARSGKLAAVRVALDARSGDDGDPVLLGRWLDEVILGSEIVPRTASAYRAEALNLFRTGEPADYDPTLTAGGRLVGASALLSAAKTLGEVDVIPRHFDEGDLVPTEVFLGLLHIAAGRTEGDLVRIGALNGPSHEATSSLSGPVKIARAEVTASAAALLDALPTTVPAAFPVGDHLLTSAELLVLLASTALNQDPSTTHPVAVKEPNAPGLGWGASKPE
jgi:hypothetical protein